MNETERSALDLDGTVDAAFARTLAPPALPVRFRAMLQEAISREADSSLADARLRLERERRETLVELERNYVRLRRQTLGTMVGGAFAAGAAAAVALPWVRAYFGAIAPLVIASTGVGVGLVITVAAWLGPLGLHDSDMAP